MSNKKLIFPEPLTAIIGKEKYKTTVTWHNGAFISDEPEELGGKTLGPDPISLLMSALATCTVATIRMYVDRKNWDIDEIKVNINFYYKLVEGGQITHIEKEIVLPASVDNDKRERILSIAEKCPVSKILKGQIEIEGTVN